MKTDKCCWLWLCVFLLACSPLPAQDLTAINGSTGTELLPAPALELESATDQQLSSSSQIPESPAKPLYGWHIAAYPVMAWMPIFGASFTLPPSPSNPIVIPSGSTNSSLNGAYFGGARFERGKWSADALFMWTALHAERETPYANVNLDFVFGDAMLGREVLPDLYVEGGFRRLALNVTATAGLETVKRSPGFWDPLLGMTYTRQFGEKWRVLIHGDGGGFGVGSDVDVTATGRAEWQFVRHFGLAMGYGGMHFSDTDTVSGATLKISPTMHGPIFGLGIFF
jgi:hypothetical protein